MSILVFIIILLILLPCVLGFFLWRKTDSSSPANNGLNQALKDNRQELNSSLKSTTDSINKQFANLQTVLNDNLESLRKDNHQQLDRMRQTVDEKLQSTLEKRLNESFKRVDQQLADVNKNMGEMQALASDVGQLQKTLTNVKTRGVWGEAHLGNLLAEILNSEQYVINFKPHKNSQDSVEFALKIPAADGSVLYLPIDAKFPLTRFEALQKALEDNLVEQVDKARKALITEIKNQAKKISSKYINPPTTTDFAIMYLPLESLYAEIAQQMGLVDELRRSYKITLAGPTTILPMIGMVGMGHRTLAIQKQASEVWQILTETQVEFNKFGALMEKTKKKLNEASDTLDQVDVRTRSIDRKFKKVQTIKADESKSNKILE